METRGIIQTCEGLAVLGELADVCFDDRIRFAAFFKIYFSHNAQGRVFLVRCANRMAPGVRITISWVPAFTSVEASRSQSSPSIDPCPSVVRGFPVATTNACGVGGGQLAAPPMR
jgi:hypothetical protein